jgi:signal transduction histidine kinase/ligand-binding sensor domain-containing protein
MGVAPMLMRAQGWARPISRIPCYNVLIRVPISMRTGASLRILIAYGILANAACLAAPRFLVRAWQSEDGLPSNAVRAVAQAADGWLWVGTAEGVVRFDGQRFTGFYTQPDTMAGRRSIRALFPVANGDVWVTTSNNMLLRGRGARLEQVPLPPSPEGAVPPAINQLVMEGDGNVFILRGAEIWQIANDNTARLAQRTPALERLLGDAAADPELGRQVQGESGVRLRTTRGDLWRFMPGEGLTLTGSTGGTELVSLQAEPPSAVRAILEDREGNIWLATGTQGLWRLRPARVEVLTTRDGLSDRASQLVLEDRAGALWVATLAGGLDCLNAETVKHFPVDPSRALRPVSALLELRSGGLLAATRDGQVYALNDGAFSRPFSGAGAPAKILAMAEDDQSQIWLGGRYGLSVWNGNDPRRTIDFGTPEVITAVVSAGPTIWAGTETGGVFCGLNDSFKAIAASDAFARQPISSLLPDSDGSLWIGTMGGGLFHFREDYVTSLAPRMSKVDPRLTCVLDDGAGYLWIGTLGGICRAEKTKLLSPVPIPGATLVLDRSDGLLTRECTSGGQPAGWRGRDGALYFSTGHGVARVRAGQLARNTVTPPVVIEEASAGGHPLAPVAERLQAGPGRTRLEFRYTALTFTAPERVRFRTKLEGLDERWRDAGEQRTVAYEAVPPGRYQFRVMAENGDGIWNEMGASLAIQVFPHYWETRWFQAGTALLVTAFAVGVGALIMRARLRGRMLRLEARTSREKERARIAQDLHDDLGASLTEISLLANLAAEERSSAAVEEDTLSDVATKAQALVGALDEIVWAVNPRHDTFRSLAEYLAAFAGKFLGRAGITLRRDVPRDLPQVSLDAERRHNIFLAVREALNNAVKHSGASEVWLRMRLEAGELNVSVDDNGHGISTQADELSEGLRGMRDRMERIGGTCRIESDLTGTRVGLTLPLPVRNR